MIVVLRGVIVSLTVSFFLCLIFTTVCFVTAFFFSFQLVDLLVTFLARLKDGIVFTFIAVEWNSCDSCRSNYIILDCLSVDAVHRRKLIDVCWLEFI